jgi:hypothetical protein
LPKALRSFRWTAHIICVISTFAVVKFAPFVVALKITIAVAERCTRALRHITNSRKITAVATVPIARLVEATSVAISVAPTGAIGRAIDTTITVSASSGTIAAVPAIPVALLVEASEFTIPVGNMRTSTAGG